MNLSLIQSLIHLHIITPSGMMRLLRCFVHDGITMMALLRFASHYYPDRCAVVSEGRRWTYREWTGYVQGLAAMLHDRYGMMQGKCVGVMCRNHHVSCGVLIALSRLGADIRLLNTDFSADKISGLLSDGRLSLVIYDDEYMTDDVSCARTCNMMSVSDIERAMRDDIYADDGSEALPRVRRGGQISIYTGGSSGRYKEARRQSGVWQYLPPLMALLRDIRIQDNDSVLIALPMYHGFGLATYIISMLMGKKMCVMRHFDTDAVLQMVRDERIQALPVVPAMLARMWQARDMVECMRSVRCIICGGDRLDQQLVTMTRDRLGDVLYNLYGTSEAGFFMLATPADMRNADEVMLGRPIRGVRCELRDIDEKGEGVLWVKSGWAMNGRVGAWQSTGDRMRRDPDGYYYYVGRNDRMVVCGGENVYPDNVERMINSHAEVVCSVVYAAEDVSFGHVLHAEVEIADGSVLTADDLSLWLRPRLSRAEMPHRIVIKRLNILSSGKRRAGGNA